MEKIAIVGLGALFPDAKNVHEFWRNILDKKVSIKPLPDSLFESDVYYRPELLNSFNKADKSVTRIAGWIEDLSFDTVRKYKIPPSVAEHMDSNQHAALYTTAQALEMNSLKEVAKDRVAVILGNGMVGTRYGDAMFRVQFQLMEHFLRQHSALKKLPTEEQEAVINFVREQVLKGTIPISEDTAPGVLPNIIAGRIANVYDFHGPSFTVDAACASVLTAVITGIQGLALKDYDAVICGGADMPLKQLGFVLFSALNALSPDGSYPFDERANGFVMGQGAGTVILKRLEDAIRDQDTIYAVITGYGEASDGKGKYIAAPNAEWQARTIEKACRMAGYPVDTIEMVEAHGTATKVGDVVEIAGLKQAFANLGAIGINFCGLTSVKSNIGHLKSAAGIAGLIKTVLAIHHQTLPPTANFEKVNPKLELDGSPFYILQEARPWQARPEYPRRANISSFGFGGADYHLTLEEYRPADHRESTATPVVAIGYHRNEYNANPMGAVRTQTDLDVTSTELLQPTASQSVPMHARPPGEATADLVFFSASDLSGLEGQARQLIEAIRQRKDLPFSERCALHNDNLLERSDAGQACRLAVLAVSADDLHSKIDYFLSNRQRLTEELFHTKGIYYKQGRPVTPAETALLFPGQASQYPDMLHGICMTYAPVRAWLRKADAYWFSRYNQTVSSLLFPSGISEEEALERLRQTHNAHPAIFVTSYALYDLLAEMGLAADTLVGHSLGEITALAAAGMLSFTEALKLVEQRGYAFLHADLADPGQMISLAGSLEEAQRLALESGADVSIANINSPHQVILAGASTEIQQLKKFLDSKNVQNKLLYVSHAFHTPLMGPVAELYYQNIKDLQFRAGRGRVVMNHTGDYYSDNPQALAEIPERLREQVLQTVNFAASIEKLYEEGVRLFVEVGPGSVLSNLVKDILSGREATILTANYKNADDLISLQKLCAALFVEGVALQLPVQTRPTCSPRNEASAGLATGAIAAPALTAVSRVPDREQPGVEAAFQRYKPAFQARTAIVYSGASIGLPGSYKDAFRDDNFTQIFEGRNQIERLTDAEKQILVDLQISKLMKDENGPTFKLLTSLDEVIQLAGKIGRLDILRDYHIDEKIVQNMTSCIALGVAAGYEALKDAQIPLVREYSQTSTGKWLPQKLALPRELQAETGIIFANGFPLIDPAIQEVSRYISYSLGSKTRKEIMAFYEGIISRVKDAHAKKLLTDWYTLYYSRLNDSPGHEDVYRFNHHFMTQISAQANNLLAQLLNAGGPNFQLNAACSSTSVAITIAEDFIRSGRVKRMLVVGADDPTSKTNFPILGAGFLCTGAATNEGDLYKAAIPFDRRRNGMIVGSGAVGIVLETREEVDRRGVAPICELLGTHAFNTCKHISQIDAETFSVELDAFIGRMEQEHGLQRDEMARQTVYIAHETYTPPRGGCSQTETVALKHTFGENFHQIIVGSTKGMTGHTMGAALEDAVAAKSLQYGQCPPVVNFSQPDPLLDGLNLWRGGNHDRTLALKMSAGFGAQGTFVLLRKACSGDERIVDQTKYAEWLTHITGEVEPELELWGRVLMIQDRGAEQARPPISPAHVLVPAAQAEEAPKSAQPAPTASDRKQRAEQIIEWIAQATGYPPEMLEADMEFAADLGIDEERRLDLAAGLAAQFGLTPGSLTLKEGVTIGQVIEQADHSSMTAAPPSQEPATSQASTIQTSQSGKKAIVAEVLRVFAEVTKYPEDMLDLDMEMEADLGIDTVKQATILSILGETYQLERQEGLQLSNYPTIRRIVDLMYERGKAVDRGQEQPAEAVPNPDFETPPTTPIIEPNEAFQPTSIHPQSNLSRGVPVLVEEALGPNTFDLKGKSVWILGDHEPTVSATAEAINRHGAVVHSFVFPDSISAQEVQTIFAAFVIGKMVDVIVDCTHLGEMCAQTRRFDQLPESEAQTLLFRSSLARFVVYKHLSGLGIRPNRIVCLTASDGSLGLDAGQSNISDPTFGALAGFYKGLRKEWNGCDVRIIDFPPQALVDDLDGQLELVLAELEHAGLGVEVSYAHRQRRIVRVEDRELKASKKLTFSSDDTFLITGGGTGIAARILLALTRAYPVKFIVVDLIALPEDIDALAALDEAGLENARQALHERLRQKHARPTPALLNREFDKLTKAIEIYNNINTARRYGCKVVYIACDVRDMKALKPALVAARQEVGPITAIIHAAGLDKSHPLEQKSAEEFQEVFSVKAQGACNLTALCQDDPLRLAVAFSSIAGRFGNAAQLDYCAANQFLTDWIKLMRSIHPNIHAVSLVWSGWKDVGIAWRNEFVRQKSEEMGLNLIEVEQGIFAFLQEIENRSEEVEILLHRGLDGFLERGLAEPYLLDFPLIDRITRREGRIELAYRLFSVQRDALIDQHRLGNIPILPAVGYAELAAEYYVLQEGVKERYLLRQMTFSNAFKLFREQSRELFVEGHPIPGGWKVEIKSSFKPHKSEEAQIVLHSSLEISSELPDLDGLDPQVWTFQQAQPTQLPAEESLLLIKKEGPEQRIILGALFNDVLRDPSGKAPVLIYPQGTIYPTYFPHEQLTNPRYPLDRLLVNPCFLDSLYQACAANLLVNKRRVYLPWEIGELGILYAPRQAGLYTCYTQVVEESDEIVGFKVVMLDEDGRICYFARRARFRLINL